MREEWEPRGDALAPSAERARAAAAAAAGLVVGHAMELRAELLTLPMPPGVHAALAPLELLAARAGAERGAEGKAGLNGAGGAKAAGGACAGNGSAGDEGLARVAHGKGSESPASCGQQRGSRGQQRRGRG